MTTNAPAQADWDYIARMLETIKSFQAEEALSIQLELRHLRSELKGVRLCQEKLLNAQLSVGADWSSLSDKGLCRTEGSSHLAPAVGGEKIGLNFDSSKEDALSSDTKLFVHCHESTQKTTSLDIEVGSLESRTFLSKIWIAPMCNQKDLIVHS
jgi:hypothetical protein